MLFKKTLIASSITVATLGLVGCGGDDSQDSSAYSSTSFTGLVVDGRIAGGLVWDDANDNGALDSFEKSATTDSQGYYTYNPETKTNYCASADTSIHCLQSNSTDGEMKIRISGGLDLDTYEPFKGVLTVKTSRTEGRSAESNIINSGKSKDEVEGDAELQKLFALISPLTSLLASVDTSKYGDLLKKLGVDDGSGNALTEAAATALLKKDFSLQNPNNTGTSNFTNEEQALLKAAYKVQKVVDTISSGLDAHAKKQDVGLGGDTTSAAVASSSDFVAKALVSTIDGLSTTKTIDDISESEFKSVATSAATELAKVLTEQTGKTVSSSTLANDNILNQSSKMARQVQTVAKDTIGAATDLSSFKNAAIKTQVVVTKAKKAATTLADSVKSNPTTDYTTTISTYVAQAQNIVSLVKTTEFETALNNASSKTVEVATLTNSIDEEVSKTGYNENTYKTSVATEVSNSSLDAVTASGSLWAGKYLSLSGKDNNEAGRSIIYFSTDKGSKDSTDSYYVSGKATLCIAYNATKDSDDIVDRFEGTWTQVGDNKSVISIVSPSTGVTFLLKSFTKKTYSSFESEDKSRFLVTPSDTSTTYGKFRFEYDGDSYAWFSDKAITTSDNADWGLVDIGSSTVPADKTSCKTDALKADLGFTDTAWTKL